MPEAEPFRLTPPRAKERGIARLGVDLLFVQHWPKANLFDIDADLCGRHLRVALVDFIRPERRFCRARRAESSDRRGCGAGAGDPRGGAAYLVGRMNGASPAIVQAGPRNTLRFSALWR